jgi:hypothetical protein
MFAGVTLPADAAAAPVTLKRPALSGTARDGEPLSTSDGVWSGTPPISYAYQWRHCDATGAACVDIEGATASAYRLTPADVGSTIRARVTATDAMGSDYRSSLPSDVVVSPLPLTLRRPALSGTARDGELLSTSDGVWSGTPPISYAYQWRRCDATGAVCVDITGATASAYRLTWADIGYTIRSRVTATDAAGSDYRSSLPSAVVQAGSVCGGPTPAVPGITHVIWIWMENKSFDGIIGNSTSAPFENQLAAACGLATNYSGVTHPSLPNYIAATSGGTHGITDDDGPDSHQLDAMSLFEQVPSWKTYAESMPENCRLTNAYPYVVKHNPAAYYTRLRSGCATNDVPMGGTSGGALAGDLAAGTLPAFSLIVPDNCNDTHDCSVLTGDRWLQTWVGQIVAGPDYRAGRTVIFLTWDEDDYSQSNQIPMIVVSPYTTPGTRSELVLNHYSLLRATEELLGVPSYLGNAESAISLRPAFGLPGLLSG